MSKKNVKPFPPCEWARAGSEWTDCQSESMNGNQLRLKSFYGDDEDEYFTVVINNQDNWNSFNGNWGHQDAFGKLIGDHSKPSNRWGAKFNGEWNGKHTNEKNVLKMYMENKYGQGSGVVSSVKPEIVDARVSVNPAGKSDLEKLLDTKSCPKCDLSGANLSGKDLTESNLRGANLTGANLTKSVLTLSNLSRANLTDANLTGAVLGTTNLSCANLTGANLYNAVLDRVIIDDKVASTHDWLD